MASLQLPAVASHFYASPSTTNKSSASQFFLNHPKRKHILRKTLSCRAAKVGPVKQEDENKGRSNSRFKSERGKLDRRDILLGLGGLYGITAVSQEAFAAPVDATNCSTAGTLPSCTNVKDKNCCPPPNPNISDYTFPTVKSLRIRPAAHLTDRRYVEKYNRAVAIMKSLPKEHPHSFAQQAAIHCAYCDSAYEMVGFPTAKIDVHFNWLFFPFHRWYLYFYEKILGKLIGDPHFAIPYWNWDARAGMTIPSMFANSNSALYDKLRNEDPQLKMDLNYNYKDPQHYTSPVGDKLFESNMSVMYRSMVWAKTRKSFFGDIYRGGDEQIDGPGTIEFQPHTAVHVLTGDPNQINGEDMGRLYSSGRDPIFYSHHANVDRLWNIWKTLEPRKNRKDFEDSDWLDSAFLFYDENEKLVRVKIRDCLDAKKMGYDYEKVPLEWYKPFDEIFLKKRENKLAGVAEVFPKADEVFPKVLDGLIKVTVPRPKKSRSKEEKEDAEEILVIDFEYDKSEYVKFDVFINDEDEINSGPNNAECVGTYSNVPSTSKDRKTVCVRFGISELLENLDADDDDTVVVALVPRTGKGKVTILGAHIIISSE